MFEAYDELIDGALDDFRAAEANHSGSMPGASAVRATVAHRRTVRLVTLGVAAAILAAAPIAAIAADSGRDNPPPASTVSDTPTPAETASPPPTPTTSPSAMPPSTPSAAVPDGRITEQQLTSTTLDLPAFGDGCPAARRKLAATGSSQPWVQMLAWTNLDDDDAQETAALLFCQLGEAPMSQVVAFDRDERGEIRVMGQIVRWGYMLHIRSIEPRPRGGISADVSDTVACCGSRPDTEQHQRRDYAWNGAAFAQVGGPTMFGDPDHVTDLEVLVTDVRLGPAEDGKRSGTATVTVRNNGPKSSGRFQVSFGNCSFTCAGMPFWAWGGSQTYHAPLAAGAKASTTVTFTFAANTPGGEIGAGLTTVARDSTKVIADLDPANDHTTFHVRLS